MVLNGVKVKYSISKIHHLLSYKNHAESTITTLESPALLIGQLQFAKTGPKGLLEAHPGTKGFSWEQKPQPACQISNLPLKLDAPKCFSEEEHEEFSV